MSEYDETHGINRKPAGAAESTGGRFDNRDRLEAPDVTLEAADVFHTRYDTMEEKLEAFRTELKTAMDNLDGDAEWQSYLDTMASFHHYSRNNRILIALQGGSGMVGGFRTWNALGRHVKAGEHGIQILAPKTIRVTDTDKDGHPVLDETGKPVKTAKCVGFTTASVFDISQTEGDPIPEGWDHLRDTPPDGYIDDLEAEIARRGYTVSYEPIEGSARGFTDPAGKVVIEEGLNPADRATTLSHELGHIVAGHLSDERRAEYQTRQHRGVMEVEAESISYVLDRANGFDDQQGTRASAQYLKGWSFAAHDSEVVEKSAGVVDTAVMELVKGGGFRNVDPRGGVLPGSGAKPKGRRRRPTH